MVTRWRAHAVTAAAAGVDIQLYLTAILHGAAGVKKLAFGDEINFITDAKLLGEPLHADLEVIAGRSEWVGSAKGGW